MDKNVISNEVEVEVLDEVKYLEEIDKLNTLIEDKKPLEIRGRISDLNKSTDPNSKKVHDGLMELNTVINDLNPENNKRFFQRGLISKVLGLNKISNYVEKYQSYEDLIAKINDKLDDGSRALNNDNLTLRSVLEDLNKSYKELQQDYEKISAMRDEIEGKLNSKEVSINERERIKAGVYTKVLQKELDIQQKTTIVKQGALSIGIMIENNQQLIESVKRAKDVTISTLELTILSINSLEQQKQVINVVDSLNKQTGSLFLHVSETIKNQGTQIQKQASSAMLDIETLTKAYNTTIDALEEINRFRIEACDKLGSSLDKLEKLSLEADEKAKGVLLSAQNYKMLENSK